MLRYKARNNPAGCISSGDEKFRHSKEMNKTDTKQGKAFHVFHWTIRGEDLWNKSSQSKQRVRFSFVSTQSYRSREEFIGRFQLQLCPTAASLNHWGSNGMAPSDPKFSHSAFLPRAGNHFNKDTHTKPRTARKNLDMEDRVFFFKKIHVSNS